MFFPFFFSKLPFPFFFTVKMTYFDTLARSYVDVDISNGINTEQFLEATEGVVKLFGKENTVGFKRRKTHLDSFVIDQLGSAAFSPVQSDLNGNIKVSFIKKRANVLMLNSMFRKLENVI